MEQQSRDPIANVWGERTLEDPERWVQSACVLCSTGCGLDIGVRDGRIVGVRGRAVDIANRGRLGPKDLNGWEANNSPDRLTRPLIRRGGKGGTLEEASWDEAMALVVSKSKELIAKHTSGSIGVYTTGQFFIEDYYTLAVIGKAGLGTPHMDGNTRLCTATAAAAMKESFGSDGQVGGYHDLDACEAVLHVGHNIASQNTIIWMRILDRRRGPNPPKLVVVDPRRTYTAEEADVHLAPKVGTNVALLNGLLHLVLRHGRLDRAFIDAHTLGYDTLEAMVAKYPPERVEEITGVPAEDRRRAADILGSANTLVSTVLQGVYQSNQATAAAVQVNNLHLVRGLVGKDACGILQMNGQPTAQNTRETGADGDLPGFRNWGNKKHVEQLAQLWNVDVDTIPHWAPPTHALQIFRYAEQGSIQMLWIMATNPAVSMPELARIRRILAQEELFVVVSDAFMTDTAQFADLDILLDDARRMDFRDKDGAPLVKWSTPEGAFEAWKACTRGRPCDYTGLSYAKLTGGSGVQRPCNERFPDGVNNVCTDLVFATDPDSCETWGQDFYTGAGVTEEEYRTFVEISERDARPLGIEEGEVVEVASRRGVVREAAHISGIIYVGLVRASEDQLATALARVADHHGDEPDVAGTSLLCAEWSRTMRASVDGVAARYGEQSDDEPAHLAHDLFRGPRSGPLALLRDAELAAACSAAKTATKRQLAWLTSRIQQSAPQALVVA